MASAFPRRRRLLPAVIAMLAMLLALTWLSQRSLNTRAEVYDRLLADLDHFGLLEAALQRDALAARAGLLRNYDPLVQEAAGLQLDLGRLQSLGREEASGALDRLTAAVHTQEVEIEALKTSNALLQNSLARVEWLTAQASQPGNSLLLLPQLRRLAAAVLHLTLDTSAATVKEVAQSLDDLERAAGPAADDPVIHGLLVHGRLLNQALPATDASLQALRTTPEVRERQALRAVLLQHQGSSRALSRALSGVLYIISLALVGLLARVGLELRSRADALRRRASFEHVIATMSMRFVKVPVQETASEIRRALAEMAACVGADRAYFLATAPYASSHQWSREGLAFPPGWPDKASELASRFGRDSGGIVHVPQIARLPSGEVQRVLAEQALKGWTCASTVSEEDARVLLGFDAVRRPCQISSEGELGLLAMALDAILNAVRRERMNAEKERLQTRLQLVRRMETVGALASGIAHNFNNIIGSMVGHAEIAQMDASGADDRARSLVEIRRAGERARELVEQILSFGGRRETRRRPISLADCVAEASSLLRGSLPRTIELKIGNIPADAIVAAEPVQLQQVILNLCANAAQAMHGAGRIEVSAATHELGHGLALSHGSLPAGAYVSLTVRDFGCGMDVMTLARIFEPFFTTRAGGNGLGLATVREIVCECEGALNVVSSPGAGTSFEVWLPRVVERDPAGADQAATAAFGNGETVLVIDEDRGQLLRSEEILAALGYEPVGFSGAERAMHSQPTNRFDAALIGHVHLEGGLAIAVAIRAHLPSLPIVLATATIDAAAAALLLSHSVREIVHRPLVSGEVAPALARSLTAQRAAFVEA